MKNRLKPTGHLGTFCFPSIIKSSSLSVFLLLLSMAGNSQLHWGVKGGLNLSTSTEAFGGARTRLAGNGGAKIWVPLGKRFFLEPELLFSGKGYRTKVSEEAKSAYRFNYISLPVLFSFLFDCKTRILAGPEIGYLVGAKRHYQSDELKVTSNIRPYISDKIEVGLAAGLNHQFTKRMHAEVRYVLGLTKLHQDYFASTTAISIAGYNRVIQIGLVYDLTKKKSQ